MEKWEKIYESPPYKEDSFDGCKKIVFRHGNRIKIEIGGTKWAENTGLWGIYKNFRNMKPMYREYHCYTYFFGIPPETTIEADIKTKQKLLSKIKEHENNNASDEEVCNIIDKLCPLFYCRCT